MTAPFRRPLRRPSMRRAVILFPSGFTLGNLFFGIFAIIAASRLQFTAAGVYVLLGGICDALDGRVARATNSGTEFGEELDSLVDAISFGLAPAMIMYFAVLNRDGWDWLFVFAFSACAVLRLARFNIEQAGTAKTYFQGLPSPAAGITLASYYWFSQSWLYTYGAVGDLPWHVLLRFIMAALSMLMISNVPYPAFPRMGLRSLRGIGASVLVVGSIVLLASRKLEYFFPIAMVYVVWGLGRWVFFGLFERRQPTVPYDLSEGEDDDHEDEYELADSQVHASKQGHRELTVARPDRPRESRPERTDVEPIPPRADRGPRRPDRSERPVAADRPAKTERPVREKKKERPKRPDRPDRAERVDREPRVEDEPRAEGEPRLEGEPRPEGEPRIETAAEASPVWIAAAPSGVGAITVGDPSNDDTPDEDDELIVRDDRGELGTGSEPAPLPAEGAPTRKRKRRRRRGERKERPPVDATSDSSPYAASPAPAATPEPTAPPTPPAESVVRSPTAEASTPLPSAPSSSEPSQ